MLQELEGEMQREFFKDEHNGKDEEILSLIKQLISDDMIEWEKRTVCGKLHYTGLICDPSTGYFWVCFINLAFNPGYLTLQPVLVEIVNKTTKRLGCEEHKTCELYWGRIKQFWIVRDRPDDIESLVTLIEKSLSKREKDLK